MTLHRGPVLRRAHFRCALHPSPDPFPLGDAPAPPHCIFPFFRPSVFAQGSRICNTCPATKSDVGARGVGAVSGARRPRTSCGSVRTAARAQLVCRRGVSLISVRGSGLSLDRGGGIFSISTNQSCAKGACPASPGAGPVAPRVPRAKQAALHADMGHSLGTPPSKVGQRRPCGEHHAPRGGPARSTVHVPNRQRDGDLLGYPVRRTRPPAITGELAQQLPPPLARTAGPPSAPLAFAALPCGCHRLHISRGSVKRPRSSGGGAHNIWVASARIWAIIGGTGAFRCGEEPEFAADPATGFRDPERIRPTGRAGGPDPLGTANSGSAS